MKKHFFSLESSEAKSSTKISNNNKNINHDNAPTIIINRLPSKLP